MSSQPGEWQIVVVYSDDASGATLMDPISPALREAKLGRLDTLLVYWIDRVSRRLRDMVTLLDELDEYMLVTAACPDNRAVGTAVGGAIAGRRGGQSAAVGDI